MIKKDLILHIGLHKTGTSTIQSFLGENINEFKRYGIHIPTFSDYIKSHPNLHHFFAAQVRSGSNETLINIIEEILKQSGNLATVLISSEMLSAKKTDLVYLKKMLSPYFSKIRICLYIRRQDELYCSIYNQIVKQNGISEEFDPTSVKYGRFYNYFELLQTFEKIWSKENITVRPYNKNSFENGNIIDDFCKNFLNISITSDFVIPKRKFNISFSPEVLEYCRLTNIIIKRNEWGSISDILTQYTDTRINQKREMQLMTPQQRAKIVQKFEDINSKVAVEFMPKSNYKLFEDVNYDEVEVFNKLKFKDALAISRFIFHNDLNFFFLILINSKKLLENSLNISTINYVFSITLLNLYSKFKIFYDRNFDRKKSNKR